MPIPIYFGSSYKRFPATFDFTSKDDVFSIRASADLAKNTDKPEAHYFQAIIGKDEDIKKMLYKIYERGNYYRFFDLYFISLFPIYYAGSYRSKDGKYYKREITWRGWVINQSFTLCGILGYLALFLLGFLAYKHFIITGIILGILAFLYRLRRHSGQVESKKHEEIENILKEFRSMGFKVTNYLIDASKCDNISDELLYKFLKIKDRHLYLNGLKKITDMQAKLLSEFGDDSMSIDGPEGFEERQLQLNGLEEITDIQAEYLSKYKGELYLNGLKTINNEQMHSILEGFKILYLNGIKELTDEQVCFISESEKIFELHLDGLKKITEDQAKKLSMFRFSSKKSAPKRLYLKGLTNLSADQSDILSMNKTISLCEKYYN